MKNYLSLLFIFVLFATHSSNAQIIRFKKIYGSTGYEFGNSVCQTFDKGYAVAGSTSSGGNGNSDAYLLKTDSLGVYQWQKTFGGINIDQAYSIQETKDTGLIIVGFTNSFGQGGYDLYVIKTNRLGDTIWTKTYGGSNWDFGYSIEQTADSGYVITGGTYSFGKGYEDMYLVKIDPVGDTLWTKTYGGIKDDEARAVKQTADGGYVLTGFTKSFGDNKGDFYTVKTNNVGDTLWTSVLGGAQEDIAFDIIQRPTGGYLLGGKTKSSGVGSFDGILINMSPTGALIWNNLYGGTDDDGIHSITQTAGMRWGMAGYSNSYGAGSSDFVLYIENPINNFHSNTFGGTNTETAYSIKNTKDNGYIICGSSASYSNLDHIFLVKTDSNGVASSTEEVTIITNIDTEIIKNNFYTIYPNPTDEKVYLSFNGNGSANNNLLTITVTDMIGQTCYHNIIRTNALEPTEVYTGYLNTGIYIIHLKNDTFSVTQKLIIEH